MSKGLKSIEPALGEPLLVAVRQRGLVLQKVGYALDGTTELGQVEVAGEMRHDACRELPHLRVLRSPAVSPSKRVDQLLDLGPGRKKQLPGTLHPKSDEQESFDADGDRGGGESQRRKHGDQEAVALDEVPPHAIAILESVPELAERMDVTQRGPTRAEPPLRGRVQPCRSRSDLAAVLQRAC